MSVVDSLVKAFTIVRNDPKVAPGAGQTWCSFVALELLGVTVGWKTMPMTPRLRDITSDPGKTPSE